MEISEIDIYKYGFIISVIINIIFVYIINTGC